MKTKAGSDWIRIDDWRLHFFMNSFSWKERRKEEERRGQKERKREREGERFKFKKKGWKKMVKK